MLFIMCFFWILIFWKFCYVFFIIVVIYSIMYMYILYVIILGLCVVIDVEFYIVIEFNGCIDFFFY